MHEHFVYALSHKLLESEILIVSDKENGVKLTETSLVCLNEMNKGVLDSNRRAGLFLARAVSLSIIGTHSA